MVDNLGLGVDQLDLEEEEDERAFGERAGAGLQAPFTQQKQQQQPQQAPQAAGKTQDDVGGLASELEAL
jgi:hypothetical protein